MNNDELYAALISEIDKYTIISFDIFDTTISRNVMIPKDIFFIVAEHCYKEYNIGILPNRFLNFRVSAEINCREESNKEDITIYDIYRKLQTMLNLSEINTKKLQDTEIYYEIKLSQKRDLIYRAYNYAIKKQKKVIFTSDMYLPVDVIKKILHRNGYTKYEDIFISSDIGLTKKTGNLFKFLYNKFSTSESPCKILHIDDVFDNVKKAREIGISAFFVPNNHTAYLATPYIKKTLKKYYTSDSKDIALSVYGSVIAKKFYDNLVPSKLYNLNSMFNNSPYNLGYIAFGYLLVAFSDWLIRKISEFNIKNVLFLSRDGFILKKSFDIVYKYSTLNDIKSIYTLSSRRAFSIPCIDSYDSLCQIFSSNYTGTIENFIKSRLGLEINASIKNKVSQKFNFNRTIDLDKDINIATDIIDMLKQEIIANANDEKENLLLYINELQLKNGPIALVDLGHTGTLANCFNKITHKNVYSLNLFLQRSSFDYYQNTENLNAFGFLLNNLPFFTQQYSLYRYIPLLETLFSTDQQQLVKFEHIHGKIVPIFLNENIELHKERLNFISKIHEGALDFVNDYCKARAEVSNLCYIDNYKCTILLEEHFKNPYPDDILLWDDVYFENNFSGWKGKAIFSSSGKYISLWDESKSNRVTSYKNENNYDIDKLSMIEKVIFILQGEKKLQKFRRNKERYFSDSKSLISKYIFKHIIR